MHATSPWRFSDGEKAYKVMLYGGDENDPSRRIEPGDEYRTEREAASEARRLLRARVGHEDGLWWSASIEKGTFEEHGDGHGYWLEWEQDDDQPVRWLVLVDGKIKEDR